MNISIFVTDDRGRDIFWCGMSKNKFITLLACLRFDNSEDQDEKRQNDPVGSLSNIFNCFISNSQAFYSLSVNVWIEEMILFLRSRCKTKCTCETNRASMASKLFPWQMHEFTISTTVISIPVEFIIQLTIRGLRPVETMRKSKRKNPSEYPINRYSHVGIKDTLLGFTKGIISFSFVPKRNSHIYVFTKDGLDALDEKWGKHSSSHVQGDGP